MIDRLAISLAQLILPRMRALGITRGDPARRMGYANQEALPAAVPFFGSPIGYVVNYSPDFALRFCTEGRLVERLDRAYRVGKSCVVVGGREVGKETLSAFHGEVPPPKLLQQQIWEE